LKTLLIFLLAVSAVAQTPVPTATPIVSQDQDVYQTVKITTVGTTVLCDSTAYIYSLTISVNKIGATGGRIIIRNRQGNSILNRELTTASGFMSFKDGLPMNDGIEIENNADNCDVDVFIDYRK
jgi:hypothetical protein